VLSSIPITEKGKPIERLGRKATGLRALAYDSGVASLETKTASGTFVLCALPYQFPEWVACLLKDWSTTYAGNACF
jgi:hypothetical protein